MREAALAGVLDPKVALFFVAFLPQFVAPSRGPVALQMLLPGVTMALLDFGHELILVGPVCRAGRRLARQMTRHGLQVSLAGVVLLRPSIRLAIEQR